MSEAELIESVILLGGAVFDSVSLYLTCVTAYLIAAYSVGARLSKFQVAVISVLFVVFTASFVLSIQTNLWNLHALGNELAGIRPLWVRATSPEMIWGLFVVDSVGVVTCLAFMWNVRRSGVQ